MRELLRREIQFNSPHKTSIMDLTPYAQGFVEETETESGLIIVSSKHTTFGVKRMELAEANIGNDHILFSQRLVPEDKRGSWATPEYEAAGFPVTDEFQHDCMRNTRRRPDQIDIDFNAGRHLRRDLFSRSSEVVGIIDGALDLGEFEHIAGLEFDGRDGAGKNPLRRRIVTMMIWRSAGYQSFSPIQIEPDFLWTR